MTGKTDKAMTTKELSDWINVPVRTLEKWRYLDKEGGGCQSPPYKRAGRRPIYWPADVKRWLQPQPQRRAS